MTHRCTGHGRRKLEGSWRVGVGELVGLRAAQHTGHVRVRDAQSQQRRRVRFFRNSTACGTL